MKDVILTICYLVVSLDPLWMSLWTRRVYFAELRAAYYYRIGRLKTKLVIFSLVGIKEEKSERKGRCQTVPSSNELNHHWMSLNHHKNDFETLLTSIYCHRHYYNFYWPVVYWLLWFPPTCIFLGWINGWTYLHEGRCVLCILEVIFCLLVTVLCKTKVLPECKMRPGQPCEALQLIGIPHHLQDVFLGCSFLESERVYNSGLAWPR